MFNVTKCMRMKGYKNKGRGKTRCKSRKLKIKYKSKVDRGQR
jgi:hypothetical protein